jgi:hypothetical protein
MKKNNKLIDYLSRVNKEKKWELPAALKGMKLVGIESIIPKVRPINITIERIEPVPPQMVTIHGVINEEKNNG